MVPSCFTIVCTNLAVCVILVVCSACLKGRRISGGRWREAVQVEGDGGRRRRHSKVGVDEVGCRSFLTRFIAIFSDTHWGGVGRG